MQYRFRDLLTGEIVTRENYYVSQDGSIREIGLTGIVLGFKAEMCTGVQDINGVDIYEGDIVHVQPNGIKWTVEYGAFGDAKFYVCNGLNSCRELEEEGCAWFSITDNRIDCEIGEFHD